jgi:glycosyltransferase involved in cell wall biosynthesis
MRKIKVVMLAPYSTHSKGSGSVIHVKKTIKYLSYRDDIELHVITLGNKNRQFKEGALNIHVIKKLLPYHFSIQSSLWSLQHKTIEINPDIVHAEGTTAPYSTTAALLRSRYPTLLTVMGVVMKEIKFQKGIGLIFYTLLHKPNERYVVSKILHIIVQSSHIKNLISKMTKSKIYVVPEGIESKKIRDTATHGSRENIDIFIAVGLVRLKGIDILINAIPTVIKSIPDLKVYIAGSGDEEERLKTMAKDLRLVNHVKFLGYISDEEEINKYYKACKIVVVPSRWDVDPFAPLIAAASGKPAIVSEMCNSSVIEDGKTGFVFKSEDVEELSSKMVKLLTDDKLREEMGKAAMEKVKEYDWSKIVDRKVEIYKEVIADFHERKEKSKTKTKRKKWKTFIKS